MHAYVCTLKTAELRTRCGCVRADQVRQALVHIASFNNARDRLLDDGYCIPIEKKGTRDSSSGLLSSALFSKEMLEPPISQLMLLIVCLWCSLAVSVFGSTFLLPIYLEQFVAISREQNYWLMFATSLLEVVGIALLFATGVLDSPDIGRRRTMLYLTIVSVFGALVLSFTWYMGPGVLFSGNAVMHLAGLIPYEIMYIYVAEILPTSHRNTGLALGNGASKAIGCLLPLLLLPLVEHPVSSMSLSQDAIRSSAIIQAANTASARQAVLHFSKVGVQEQLALNASADADANGTLSVVEAQPVSDAGPLEGTSDVKAGGPSASKMAVAPVSVPYAALTISCIIAAVLLYLSPDPSESLCDTVIETGRSLESARWGPYSGKSYVCSVDLCTAGVVLR
jgi:hypothetical protein